MLSGVVLARREKGELWGARQEEEICFILDPACTGPATIQLQTVIVITGYVAAPPDVGRKRSVFSSHASFSAHFSSSWTYMTALGLTPSPAPGSRSCLPAGGHRAHYHLLPCKPAVGYPAPSRLLFSPSQALPCRRWHGSARPLV